MDCRTRLIFRTSGVALSSRQANAAHLPGPAAFSLA
jgi:hypothetical protein